MDRGGRREEERRERRAAERKVGRMLVELEDAEVVAVRRVDGDTTRAGGPEPPARVDLHAVRRPAAGVSALVHEEDTLAEREVALHRVAPDHAVVRVANVERGLVRREGEAVGLREAFA